jgi:multicomponent Na+:H+ antiporter subunit G
VIAVLDDLLVVLGLVLLTIGVYGVVRLPDVYTQLHAASKAGFLGVAALLASAALGGDGAIVARAVLITALLAFTTPVAAHAVGRAARRRGEPMRTPDAVDES